MSDPEIVKCDTDGCGFRGSRKVVVEKYDQRCPLCDRRVSVNE